MKTIVFVVAMVAASNAWADFADLQAKLDSLSKPKPKPKVVKVEKKNPVYNTVWKGKTYGYPTHKGIGGLRFSLIDHLMGELNGDHHQGKFDRKELEKLSIWELEALHSNDHVNRPYVTPAKPAKKSQQATKPQQACPT